MMAGLVVVWMYSIFRWVYFVGPNFCCGAAMGSLHVMVATGSHDSSAYLCEPRIGSQDIMSPTIFFTPTCVYDWDTNGRKQGLRRGTYSHLIPGPSLMGLRLPRVSEQSFASFNAVSRVIGPSVFYNVELPIWAVFFFLLILMLVQCWVSSRRQPSSCDRCQYNLSGNLSGICPECGTAIPLEQMEWIKQMAVVAREAE